MNRSRRRFAAYLGSICAVVLAAAAGAQAASKAAQRLVDTYSPIVMLRAQEHPPCDNHEEQYQPTTVNVVLGNPAVRLIPPPGRDPPRPVERAPTAADIAGRGQGWHLDLPGNPLEPGCTYARDFAAIEEAGEAPVITYAHVRRQPGVRGLFVQYWFYYYFNQFNDLHESDWEGMQIAFDANAPRKALAAGPTEVALFQHSGGETADWDGDKLERRGTHPVVYPAAGSHATFYDSTIYIENGQRGSGLGCDNASEPSRAVRPRPVVVPTNPRPGSRFEWLTYEGPWGQREGGFNNGPTGPNTKPKWLTPSTSMSLMRSSSAKLPGHSILGPAVTSAFCVAVAEVSRFLNLAAASRARRDRPRRRGVPPAGGARVAHPLAPRRGEAAAAGARLRTAAPGCRPAVLAPFGHAGPPRPDGGPHPRRGGRPPLGPGGGHGRLRPHRRDRLGELPPRLLRCHRRRSAPSLGTRSSAPP